MFSFPQTVAIAGLFVLCCWTVSPAASAEVGFRSQKSSSNRFFPSWGEELALSEQRFESEMKKTIEMLPNVNSSRVHVSFAPKMTWTDEHASSTVSVVVLSEAPKSIQIVELKRMVAGASSRLSEANVGVYVYKVSSDKNSHLTSEASMTRSPNFIDKWKRYIVALILVLMGGALLTVFVGVRRLLRKREWYRATSMKFRSEEKEGKGDVHSASLGSVK